MLRQARNQRNKTTPAPHSHAINTISGIRLAIDRGFSVAGDEAGNEMDDAAVPVVEDGLIAKG
jgi:hypothetical protein